VGLGPHAQRSVVGRGRDWRGPLRELAPQRVGSQVPRTGCEHVVPSGHAGKREPQSRGSAAPDDEAEAVGAAVTAAVAVGLGASGLAGSSSVFGGEDGAGSGAASGVTVT
jgi:hypothetical protein